MLFYALNKINLLQLLFSSLCRNRESNGPLPPHQTIPPSSRALAHWSATPAKLSFPPPRPPKTFCLAWTPNAKGRTSTPSPPTRARRPRTVRRFPAACYSWPNPKKRKTRRRKRERVNRTRLQVELLFIKKLPINCF